MQQRKYYSTQLNKLCGKAFVIGLGSKETNKDTCLMTFEIIGKITAIEKIASTKSIRDINRLNKQYGIGKWRKLKGKATVKFLNGIICKAEIHWYEAHGIGKRKIKVKRIIEG